jgi:sugar phosphate isomerase/epimerase
MVARPLVKRSVSLYSLQEEYYYGRLDLEGCLSAVASTGATGVEVLAESMFPDFPNPSETFRESWFGWLEKYGLTPTCYDAFLESKLYRNRVLTLREQVAMTERDIRLAARFGFKTLRTLCSTPIDVIEGSLDCAEREGVTICLEVHAPFALDSEWSDLYLKMIHRTGTKVFGFMPDFGMFYRNLPPVARAQALRKGAHPDLLRLVDEAYAERVARGFTHIRYSLDLAAANQAFRRENGMFDLKDKLEKLGANAADLGYLSLSYNFTWNDPSVVTRNIAHIHHTHAKFHEVDEHYVDTTTPLPEVLAAYIAGGYDGYLSSEYEGHSSLNDALPVDSVEQVRRQQEAMRRILEA